MEMRKILIGLVVGGFVGLMVKRAGCGGGDSQPPQPQGRSAPQKTKVDLVPPAPQIRKGDLDRDADTSQQALDFTGLRGVLAGKWELKEEQEYRAKPTLDFTEGNTVFLKRCGSEKVAKYDFKAGVLTITTEWDGIRRAGATLKPKSKEQKDQPPNEYVYGVEFRSDGVVSLRLDRSGDGFDWFQLAGQWRRISLPPGKDVAQLGTGPIADAKRQVKRIEQKEAKLESLLKTALADPDPQMPSPSCGRLPSRSSFSCTTSTDCQSRTSATSTTC